MYVTVASEEVVSFMENYCNWWRLNQNGSGSNVSSKGMMKSPVQDDMVQLLPGYQMAMISRRKRNVLTRQNKENPSKMATSLIKALVPEDQLKRYKARGRKHDKIPDEIMKAVEEYVALHASKTLSSSKFTKAVNNMIYGLTHAGRPRKNVTEGTGRLQKSPSKNKKKKKDCTISTPTKDRKKGQDVSDHVSSAEKSDGSSSIDSPSVRNKRGEASRLLDRDSELVYAGTKSWFVSPSKDAVHFDPVKEVQSVSRQLHFNQY